MDFDFASSSSVASSPGGGGGGEDGGGSKVFGSFLVDKHSSTPYTDATQVIQHSFFRNCKYWETGVCHLIETRNQAADMTKNKLLLFGRKNDRGNAPSSPFLPIKS